MVSKLLFGIYVVYCFEVGLFLIFFPWMDLWKYNQALYQFPALKVVFLNDFFRGGVTGLGVANLILGIWEISNLRRYFKKS